MSARGWAFDALLAVAVCVVAGYAGARYMRIPAVAASAQYYQETMGPAVLFACGRGAVNTPELLGDRSPAGDALTAFLSRGADHFDCSLLPPHPTVARFTALQSASRYLLLAVGWVWWLRGVTWSGLSPIFGILFGVVSAATYLLFRLASNRVLALGATAILASSAAQLGNLPHLRDYSKAPFFVVTLLILGYVVTRTLSRRSLSAWSVLVGVWIGIGFGIRFDVAPYLAFFVAGMVLFSPGSFKTELPARLVAAAMAVLAFLVTAAPILRAFQLGNNSWHVVLLGFAAPHDAVLGIQRSFYELGTLYDDSYVSVMVNSYWWRLHGPTPLLYLDTPEYAVASAGYYRDVARVFPADLVVRAWAAVLQVLKLPFLPSSVAKPGGIEGGAIAAAYAWRLRSLALTAWMAPWVPIAVIVAMARTHLRQAMLVAVCICFFGGYASLQFQLRHVFPLEIVTIWLFACAAQACITAARGFVAGHHLFESNRPTLHGARPLAFAAFFVVVIVGPVATLRAYQERQVSALLMRYDNASRSSELSRPSPAGDGLVRFAGLARPTGSEGAAVTSDLFLAEFGGASCDYDSVDAVVRYVNAPEHFSRVLHVRIPERASDVTRVFFVVYGASSEPYAFAGLDVDAAKASCVTGFGRITDVSGMPLLIDMTLPPDWQTGHLYQTVAGWERAPAPHGYRETYASAADPKYHRSALSKRLEPMPAATDYVARVASVPGPGRVEVNRWTHLAGWLHPVSGYLASWAPSPAGVADLLVAEGDLVNGSVVVSLVRSDVWDGGREPPPGALTQVPVSSTGSFRVVIQPPADALYGVVIAAGGQPAFTPRLTVSRIGWIRGAEGRATAQ